MRIAVCTFAFSEIAVSQVRALEDFCDATLFLPTGHYWRAHGLRHAVEIRYSPQQSTLSKCMAVADVLSKLREIRPDVLHLQGVASVLLPFLPRLATFRLVVSVHDPRFHSGEENWIAETTQRLVTRVATKVIVMSDAMRATAVGAYPDLRDKLTVIPFGIHDLYTRGPERRPARLSPDERFILLFGRLSPYKGVEDVLDAVARAGSRLEHRLVLAGKQLYPIHIPAELNDRVVAIDEYIDDDLLRYVFRHSDLVVLPYRDATQSAVLMTAYAFGKPVIVTRVGGLPEMVREGQTGFVVPPSDPESLASCLIDAVSHPARLADMGKEALAFGTANFSWRSVAEKHIKVYADAMQR